MSINPYLNFEGCCEEAFNFYAAVLGGKIEMLMRYAGSPAEDEVTPEWREKVMHVTLVAGDSVLMGSDVPAPMFEPMKGMTVAMQVDDPAEAEKLFTALAEGGAISMPMEETFWALRFGMVTDRFGTPWMVNCDKPM